MIPQGCASIGEAAFAGCRSLARVTIPKSCALGAGVFVDSPNVMLTGQ
jgi:hypothetical protein